MNIATILLLFYLVDSSKEKSSVNKGKVKWNSVEGTEQSKLIPEKSMSLGMLVEGFGGRSRIFKYSSDQSIVDQSFSVSSGILSNSRKIIRQKNQDEGFMKTNYLNRKKKEVSKHTDMPDIEKKWIPMEQGRKPNRTKIEKDRKATKSLTNEVATVAKNEEVEPHKEAHREVNENDKTFEGPTVPTSTDKEISPSSNSHDMQENKLLDKTQDVEKEGEDDEKIFEDKKPDDKDKDNANTGDDKKNAAEIEMDDEPEKEQKVATGELVNTTQVYETFEIEEFIDKLNEMLTSFGDYILALLLKDLKLRLRRHHVDDKFYETVRKALHENGGNRSDAIKLIENQIKGKFGKSFQLLLRKYLESLVNDNDFQLK